MPETAENIVSLRVNGQVYEGWTKSSVTRSLRTASGSFELELTEKWPGQKTDWRIKRGDAVTLELDSELELTGFVDIFAPSYDATTHAVRVSGRSKTCDLVDCAALVKGGQFKGYTLAAIAKALAAPFGINVIAGDTGAPFADVQIQPGETCFEVIDRLCRLRAFLASDNARGDLVLTRAGTGGFGRSGALVEGRNIIAGSASLSHAARFSEYVVRGQQAGSDDISGPQASQPQARVTDAAVKRYRPNLILAEAPGGIADMEKRARWQQRFAAADGTTAGLTVEGWRDDAGALWQAGNLSAVDSPLLGLQMDMLIDETVKTQSNDGSRTELALVPPDALTPEPVSATAASASSGAGKGSSWSEVI
tara:strand:- start:9141 stop:10235 length:1095 start_codon:yes stop_codon:yes gene_type:complete